MQRGTSVITVQSLRTSGVKRHLFFLLCHNLPLILTSLVLAFRRTPTHLSDIPSSLHSFSFIFFPFSFSQP